MLILREERRTSERQCESRRMMTYMHVFFIYCSFLKMHCDVYDVYAVYVSVGHLYLALF